MTSSPSFLAGARHGRRRQRRTATSTSSSSSTPTPVLVETQTIGVSVPCRTASAQSRSSSSFDGISPSKYFSITASSTSMIDSITDSLSSAGSISAPAVSARHIERADDALEIVPLPDRHVEQHALRAEHFADRVDRAREVDVVGVQLGDAEMRPRPALPASCHTRRVLTLMPAWASIAISAVSTARSAPIVWPMRSG